MNRDDVIRMAKEADLIKDWMIVGDDDFPQLEKFSNLIASHVAEECAKACETRYMGDNNREDIEARRCAAAIRSLYKTTS